ncbi:MAG: MASE1 domain-containing protein [Chrysiogenetes bacterium]|nr:MASE1 domain-containing protein [Chrysiogenetes bacterium]
MVVGTEATEKRREVATAQDEARADGFALRLIVLAVAYFLAARVGLSLAFTHHNVSPVWPPTGLAIAVLGLGGIRYWPGIFLGALSANFFEFVVNDQTQWWIVFPSLLIAAGNTLEAAVSIKLIRRRVARGQALQTERDILWAGFSIGAAGIPISASIGVLSLCLFSLADWSQFGMLWGTWWTGDFAGAVILAPAIVAWRDFGAKELRALRPARVVEAMALVILLLADSAVVFGGFRIQGIESSPLLFTLLPLFIWSVLRFGQRGGMVAVLVISWLAIEGTIEGYGPFALDSLNASLAFLQAFMVVITATALILAAILSQRNVLADALKRQKDELEHRVEERTVELHSANTLLREEIRTRRLMEEERLAMERRALEGQKLESLGVLTGGIAHDFNNLLVPILGYASLAEMKLPEDSEVRKDMQKITTSANRAAALIRQLLAYAGRARMSMESISLNTIVEEMDELLDVSTPKHVVTKLELEKSLPMIYVDVAQVTQVVLNLLRNAADAIGLEPGEVNIHTRVLDMDKKALEGFLGESELESGDYVCLEVKDSGCGMDERTRQRIFEPFFSTKEQGRGLGLSAILGIMRSHKGGVAIESTPGRGTTVRVIFPVYGEARAEEAPEDRTAPAPRLQGSVLVVDDEEPVRGFAVRALEDMGLSVLEAADGAAAIGKLNELGGKVEAVVLDLTMPKLSGTQLLAEIRKCWESLPVVLVSGFADAQALAAVDADPCAWFLQKPYAPGQLRQALLAVARLA